MAQEGREPGDDALDHMVTTLHVPSAFVSGFEAIAVLSTESFDRLVGDLEEAPLLEGDQLAHRAIQPSVGSDKEAHQIAASLTSLLGYGRRHGEAISDLADGVAASPDLDLTDESRTELGQRLLRLLGLRPVVGAAKVEDLLYTDNTVESLQVVTETRFLFDDDADGPEPYGVAIAHTLRIQTASGERDATFALRTRDLATFEARFERARQKADSLTSRLSRDGWPVLDETEETEG